MKKYLYFILLGLLWASCAPPQAKKSIAYKGMYSEKPVSVLIMPPINKTLNIDAKEYFHSTLNVPIANAGFYVVPPFLSMEILKRESAYDSELFLNSSISKFGEVFQADVVLFTIIHKWDKGFGSVKLDIEYIFKSTKTNAILYTRRGLVNFNTSVSSGSPLDLILTAVNTAATKYVDVARVTNLYTFKDLPAGKYSLLYGLDGETLSGKNNFKVNLDANYK
jgi:hypothetical protein